MKLKAFKTITQAGALLVVVAAVAFPNAAQRTDSTGADSISSQAISLTAGAVQGYNYGFDSCNAPSSSDMDTWFTSSPAWWWGVYIGGSAMSCANTIVTQSWVNHQVATGWDLLFIWVGPQAPCSGFGSRFSSDPSTAAYQGHVQADNALQRAADLGLTITDLPIVYDLEAYPSSCVAAAQSFMNGWTKELHVAPAQESGLYGSGCGSSIDDFYGITYRPNFIWGANYDTTSHADTIGCVASNHWVSKRHKQYLGGKNKTYGGVQLSVDTNCSNGAWLYGNSDTGYTPACL